MKNKKKDSKNIWVYVAIILLLLVIILPPLFRLLLKDDTPNIEIPKDPATALICTKEAVFGNVSYQIKATTNYAGTKLSKVTLQYQRTGVLDAITSTNEIEQEMQAFRNSNNIALVITELEDGLKFVVTLEDNKTSQENVVAAPYFNDLTAQALLFSEKGYTCQQITS